MVEAEHRLAYACKLSSFMSINAGYCIRTKHIMKMDLSSDSLVPGC